MNSYYLQIHIKFLKKVYESLTIYNFLVVQGLQNINLIEFTF